MNKNIFTLIALRLTLLVMGIFGSLVCWAQPNDVEMADTMRSNGKIYVVVAVCLTILVGLFLYMVSVDRRLRKLEKENV
jgi:hypothetical protein